MPTVTLRGVSLGAGQPKICVPLTGGTVEELLAEIAAVKSTEAHLVEWRADHYSSVADHISVLRTLEQVRFALGQLPLLFTFRTAREGGVREYDSMRYRALCKAACESGLIDAVDIELAEGDDAVAQAVEWAHAHRVASIVSNHNFHNTPPQDQIIAHLATMRQLGADIPKIAVMPNHFSDVLVLMAATSAYTQTSDCPVITMSMGRLGCISRISGEYTGSCLTFGTVTHASAPGQLAVSELHTVLTILGAPSGEPPAPTGAVEFG